MPTGEPDPHRFDFDLDRGIREQAVEKLEASPALPLSKGVGPPLSGIYALYFKGDLVYIGKAAKEMTKSGRTLKARLNEHVGKIEGRQHITLADMTCRFLTFDSEWWVIAAEYALIAHYHPPWNASGFGSKVPGVGRPGKPGRFNKWAAMFPPLAVPPTASAPKDTDGIIEETPIAAESSADFDPSQPPPKGRVS